MTADRAAGMRAHPRLSLNQATIKRATLAEALATTADAGIGAIGLWREPVAQVGLRAAAAMVADSGLRVSSLCRGGFFTVPDGPARSEALADNRRAIEETATLAEAGAPGSAPVLVLVAGGIPAGVAAGEPGTDLRGARVRVADALGALAEHAEAAGVTLAIEPMHPMYAADRGVVSTLGQALDLAEPFPPSVVGVVVDTFHVWWDPEVLAQIRRAGQRIASYQVNDWITPLPADTLLARGMLGDGHIDLPGLSAAVEAAGYTGDIEVEIFNQQVWDQPFGKVADTTAARFTAIGLPA
jgi:sugar phosphate isomerase/epimerase